MPKKDKRLTVAHQYSFLTPEQQAYLDSCDERLRKYIESRAKGATKVLSYTNAGYKTDNASQGANMLERRNPLAVDLIQVMQTQFRAASLFVEGSKTEKEVMAVAKQKDANMLLDKLNNINPDTAQSIMFYKDVASGKIKTQKVVKVIDPKTREIVKETIEEINDVRVRMEAQKKLDEWCGFNTTALRVDTVQANNNFTINIIDCSMKKDTRDKRDDCSLLKQIEEEVGDGEREGE